MTFLVITPSYVTAAKSSILFYIHECSLIPVATLSKTWVCGCSLAGIAGLNPAGGMDVSLSCDCCMLSGRGLCVGLITRPEES